MDGQGWLHGYVTSRLSGPLAVKFSVAILKFLPRFEQDTLHLYKALQILYRVLFVHRVRSQTDLGSSSDILLLLITSVSLSMTLIMYCLLKQDVRAKSIC